MEIFCIILIEGLKYTVFLHLASQEAARGALN